MDRFRATYLLLIGVLLSAPVIAQNSAQYSAQATDDLPAAPSAVIQKKQAPPHEAAPATPQAQNPQSEPQTESSAPVPPSPEDSGAARNNADSGGVPKTA